MIQFLFKGLIRDKNRCLLPIIVVSIGVAITVFMSGYIRGAIGDMVDITAKFDTGHVKVMTHAYSENIDQLPNDLAILGVNNLIIELTKLYPKVTWVNRIKFGGLLDVPDENGETIKQGPAMGIALGLFSNSSNEVNRLKIDQSIVKGNMPKANGEALIGVELAKKLGLNPQDHVTFFGSTMNGSMAFKNFIVTGFVRFGPQAMDQSAIIVDIEDAQQMLDMEDASGEILGFFENDLYFDDQATTVSASFNTQFFNESDPYSPIMLSLKEQGNMGSYLDYVDLYVVIFVGIFVMAMSVVLWNTGLLGGLRRYQEFGIRLALGESKSDLFRSLIIEALLIGIIGSISGTLIGLLCTWGLQVHGIDIGNMTANSTMMMPSVIRSRVTPDLFYIGFIPGVFAMVLGNILAGLGIYKRETAQLFKELEV